MLDKNDFKLHGALLLNSKMRETYLIPFLKTLDYMFFFNKGINPGNVFRFK